MVTVLSRASANDRRAGAVGVDRVGHGAARIRAGVVRVAWSVTEAPNRTVIFAPSTLPELRLVVMSGLNWLMTVVSPCVAAGARGRIVVGVAAVRGDPVVRPVR